MSEERSDSYTKVHVVLEEFKQKLVEISALDLSKIHISHEWSWVPYVKDHLDFLIEQVGGLSENLQDSPPPETPEEIKTLKNDQNTNI
jgi:hypothetical protein